MTVSVRRERRPTPYGMSVGRSANWTSAMAKTPMIPRLPHFLAYGLPRIYLGVEIFFGYAC